MKTGDDSKTSAELMEVGVEGAKRILKTFLAAPPSQMDDQVKDRLRAMSELPVALWPERLDAITRWSSHCGLVSDFTVITFEAFSKMLSSIFDEGKTPEEKVAGAATACADYMQSTDQAELVLNQMLKERGAKP